MTLSISGTASAQPAYTPTSSPTPSQQQEELPSDTVELSQSAQISQLNHQGQSVSQIAENFGIAVSLVNLDLGIVATNVVSTAPAVSAPPTAAATKIARA
jgi:hypothetical protein